MPILADRIDRIPVSQTLAMAARERELRAAGQQIISLSLGQPDFDTPDFIKAAAKQAIDDNYNAYTPVNGYADLRQAICEKLQRDNDLVYSPEQIVVSTGAKQSLANAILALVNDGDEVLMPVPYWVSYEALIRLAKGVMVPITTTVTSEFKISPEQLEAAITEKTKLLILNSPNNPSGAVYSREEYQALAQVLAHYPQVQIISDEIYEHIIYEGAHCSIASFEALYERTITINGLSKAFAMTGWRLGYLAAPLKIAKACNKIQGQITSGTNCITQRAAITALQAPVTSIHYMVEAFSRRRDLVWEGLRQIPGLQLTRPAGAFYFFPDVSSFFGRTLVGSKIDTAADFSELLLLNAHVSTVSGEAFGSTSNIRLSYATSEALLMDALERMATIIGN